MKLPSGDQSLPEAVAIEVTSMSLIRIAIAGEVVRPGFYAVSTDLVLADAVMVAGGATPDGRLDKLRIERGERRLFEPRAVEQAIARGQTLDDLDLQAGDRIVVPERRGGISPLIAVLGPAVIYAVIALVK